MGDPQKTGSQFQPRPGKRILRYLVTFVLFYNWPGQPRKAFFLPWRFTGCCSIQTSDSRTKSAKQSWFYFSLRGWWALEFPLRCLRRCADSTHSTSEGRLHVAAPVRRQGAGVWGRKKGGHWCVVAVCSVLEFGFCNQNAKSNWISGVTSWLVFSCIYVVIYLNCSVFNPPLGDSKVTCHYSERHDARVWLKRFL